MVQRRAAVHYAPLVMIRSARGTVLDRTMNLLCLCLRHQARNTVGSGDATLAGLVAGLIQVIPSKELRKLATAAGSQRFAWWRALPKGEIAE